jgi:hypothetical protein
LVVWFCSVVVLLSYSWFGRQVWVFNYFFLTSWNFMASTRLLHFRIAICSPNVCLILYLAPSCFQFIFSGHFGGVRCWMLSMLRCSTPANPRTWSIRCWMLSMLRCSKPAKPRTWSARRLSCRQVIQYFFSLSEFLLTHSGFAAFLFMGRSAECCRCVLQFSC